MAKISTFLDSDVFISALISQRGAAYKLFNLKEVERWISTLSLKEINRVLVKKNIKKTSMIKKLKKFCRVLNLKEEDIEERFGLFVKDINDKHVIAGAYHAKAEFLITYNKKDFVLPAIERKLGIKVLSPGEFLRKVVLKNYDYN